MGAITVVCCSTYTERTERKPNAENEVAIINQINNCIDKYSRMPFEQAVLNVTSHW